MAIQGTAGPGAGAGKPDGASGRTVAMVDLGSGPVDRPPGAWDGEGAHVLALRAIQQTVRGEDRICPFGTTRVAVVFGPDADTVSPRTLAQRLARAVRQAALLVDGAAGGDFGPTLSPAESGTPPQLRRAEPSPSTVTVDRLVDPVRRLRHRTVVRCSSGGFARYGTRHSDVVPGDRGTILVVSPCRAPGGSPGLPAIASSAMAERLGYQVEIVALASDDELVLDVRGAPVELVVLVVEGEREVTGDHTTWATSMWSISAQLTARFCSQGIEVLAVGAGSGYGALASCVVQGAAVALHLDDLHAALSRAADAPAIDGSWGGLVGGDWMPQPMEALVLLTASERRVLFYLTLGLSAQEIADDLVVSVTTVRSHIRSILRKLGVRSQLAAVAIANSQDWNATRPGSPVASDEGSTTLTASKTAP